MGDVRLPVVFGTGQVGSALATHLTGLGLAVRKVSRHWPPGWPTDVEGLALGERVFANALAGRRADLIGNPDLLHTCSYVPDIAAGLATLGPGAPAARQRGWGHSMRSVTSPPGRTCSPAVQPTSIDTPPRSRT